MRQVGAVAVVAVVTACSGGAGAPAATPSLAPSPSTGLIGAGSSPQVAEPPINLNPRDNAHGPGVQGIRRVSGMSHVSAPVPVRAGLEAASWTSTGTAIFEVWRFGRGGRHLTRIGRTTYPVNPYFGDRCFPRVTGARLAHAADATFILHQCFSGDGGVNAAAISNGAHGWGPLLMLGPHRYASTGATKPHPNTAVRWDIEFDHGDLATIDGGNGYLSNAGSNLFPRVRLWTWRDGRFSATADSGFVARPAPPPSRTVPVMPAGNCPSNGTYRASFGVSYGRKNTQVANSPLRLMAFPSSGHYPARSACAQIVPSSLPLTIQTAHTDSPLTGLHYKDLTNKRWVTAPAWMLISGNEGLGAPTPMFKEDTGIDSPYQVPPSLGVNLMLTRFRASDKNNFGGYTPDHGIPPAGTVTFASGRITALSIGKS